MKNKKAMKGWVWLLIALGIIAVAVIVYLLISSGNGSSVSSGSSLFGGKTLTPPALPN